MKHPQTILVTGASSGFGKIIATQLAEQGHTVYGTSRKAVPGNAATTPESTDAPHFKMLQLDITDPASISRVLSAILTEQRHIDVLINNAGMGISGVVELTTEADIQRQMDTNFMGTVRMSAAVLPSMRSARRGRIINVSSIAGMLAVPFQAFYSASKFAIEGYSEALYQEVKPLGIQVCVVEPGDFRTGFTAQRQVSEASLAHPHYGESFAKAMRNIEKSENNGCPPEKLGKAICKLVNSRHPAFRTKVGPWEQVFFARIKPMLPFSLVDLLIRKFY